MATASEIQEFRQQLRTKWEEDRALKQVVDLISVNVEEGIERLDRIETRLGNVESSLESIKRHFNISD